MEEQKRRIGTVLTEKTETEEVEDELKIKRRPNSMGKIIRFFDMSVLIPMKDGETEEEIEDRLIDAVENAGSIVTSYKTETEEVEDE